MSIDHVSKTSIEKLFKPLIECNLKKEDILSKIKRNNSQYAKFTLLLEQADFLKRQLQQVINESILNINLEHVKCQFKKIPGNTYHLYQKSRDDTYYFSMLSFEEWSGNPPDTYIRSYYYDFDNAFKPVN